jgi:hypothetical protein
MDERNGNELKTSSKTRVDQSEEQGGKDGKTSNEKT